MTVAARRFGRSLRRAQWRGLRVVRPEKTAAGEAGNCIPPFAAMLEEKRSPCGRGAPRPSGPRGGRGAVVARALRAQEKRLHVFSFGYMYRFPRDLHIGFICFSITCIHFWLHVFSLRYMYSASVTCIQPVLWWSARKRRSRATCSAVTEAPPCVLRCTRRKMPKGSTARSPGFSTPQSSRCSPLCAPQ